MRRDAKKKAPNAKRRTDQVSISGMPAEAKIEDRVAAFVSEPTVKKSDVLRNALLAGLRQFEADGYEVMPLTRIERKAVVR